MGVGRVLSEEAIQKEEQAMKYCLEIGEYVNPVFALDLIATIRERDRNISYLDKTVEDMSEEINRLQSDLEVYHDAHEKVQRQTAILREALNCLLLSADCSWEEQNEGHDWALACEKAREALAKIKGE